MKLRNRQMSPGKSVLLIAFLIVAAVMGALMMQRYEARHEVPVQPHAEKSRRSVVLFFAAMDGSGLVREARPLEECDGDEECIWETVMELVKGPLGDLAPVLPAQTVLDDAVLQGDTVVLDFSRDMLDAMPEGSSAEMAAVYGVVNSIAFNFPAVKKVAFHVGGSPVNTFGHLDLRPAVVPDFSLERAAGAGDKQ